MRTHFTGAFGKDNVGCVLVLALLCGIAALVLFSGCATLGQVPIRVCASKDKFSACVDVGAPRSGAIAPAILPLPGAPTPQSAGQGRIWTGSHGRFEVWPADAVGVQIGGEYAVPEDLAIEAVGELCSSEDPTCFWPAPVPRPEASCYDPWIGRCHPWEEAVRLGIVPPGTPFAAIAFHDERLAPCWRSAVGRAPSDPGPLFGRVTGRCGAEWESQWQVKFLPALEAAGVTDPLTRQPLNLCGPATREQALMATWECTESCQARVLAEPGGAGLTEAHPSVLQAKDWPGLPLGPSVQAGTWGCPWYVRVEGALPPPPPPPPPPSPCPTGQACRPEPAPCPSGGGPACPDLAKRIGEEIAAATADHRANSAKLLREIFTACSAPAPACPEVCPPVTIPAGEIGELCRLAVGREVAPLVAEIGRLRGAVETLGTKGLPPECEGVLAQVESLGTLKVGSRVRWEAGRAAAVSRTLACLRAMESR